MIKKLIAFVLVLPLLLCGCVTQNNSTELTFYYVSHKQPYYEKNGVIGTEVKPVSIDPLNHKDIFELYLSGPKSKDLTLPFPKETKIVKFSIEQDVVNIVLDNSFATLSGVELSLACACISLTANSITGYTKVNISAQSALLDGIQSISIDTNSLIITE